MSPEKAALVNAISALDKSAPDVLTERKGGVSYDARKAVTQDIDNLERVALSVADRFEEATAARAAKDGTIQRLSAELALKEASMIAALKLKNDALKQKDADYSAALRQKDAVMFDALKQMDDALEQKHADYSAALRLKDVAIAEKNRVIGEKDREILEMDKIIAGLIEKSRSGTWANFAYEYRWPAGAALAAAGLWCYYANRK